MRHLVMDSCSAADVVAFGHLAAEDQNIFVESYAADVLHRAPVVFSNCDLVVLTEWVSQTESLFKVSKALLSNFEDIFCINVLEERFTSIDAQRNCLLALVFIMNRFIGAGNNRCDVGRNHLRSSKLNVLTIAVDILS